MTDKTTMIKLELTLEEVNGILAALGELPVKTGAHILVAKIQAQGFSQLPKEEPKEEPKAE